MNHLDGKKKKTIIILAAAAVSTTIEKRFLFDFHIICRSAGIFFSKKNDIIQRYNSSDGDTTFDKWWIVDDFLRWSPHYTRVISTSFVQLYGSWRDSILIHILEKNCTTTWIIIIRLLYSCSKSPNLFDIHGTWWYINCIKSNFAIGIGFKFWDEKKKK